MVQNPDPAKKYFYFGNEVFFSKGKWRVVQNGEWFEFYDWEKAEESKKFSLEKKDRPHYGKTVTKTNLWKDLETLNPIEYVVKINLDLHMSNDGKSWPTIRTQAKQLHLNPETICRAVNSLQEKHILKIKKVPGRGGLRNEYWLKNL